MTRNPLIQLHALEQSVWLDYVQRDFINSGELHRLIQDDGLKGMTTNPSIFEKAINRSHLYDDDIHTMILQGKNHKTIYENICLKDVQMAADVFWKVYNETNGRDGYVSMEVAPRLSTNTNETIDEARRLWKALDRPNIFIKVPATNEGIPAIRQLISEGINVNVTLLFGLTRYQQVVDAYMSGIEYRLENSLPVDKVASVASFFVSRIDSMIDPLLKKFIEKGGKKAEIAEKLLGQVAIANAKEVYNVFVKNFNSRRYKYLSEKGANIQRLLWASTSTKNPTYSDIAYVESLIAPNTISTMPMETLNAYRDHGNPRIRIDEDIETSQWILEELPGFGIIYENILKKLEEEGINKFIESYDNLIATLSRKVPLYL